MPKAQHGRGFDAAHQKYNDMVQEYMDLIFDPSMTPKEAYDELLIIIDKLRSQLAQGLPLDQITLP